MQASKAFHHFHIPVMGLAFTIDTPIKVAHFGISSVVSIIQDNLIEKMRKHYYQKIGETYTAIEVGEEDYRAKRITDYLNLMNRIVQHQVEKVRESDFGNESDIDTYFAMLPDDSPLKKTYSQMKELPQGDEKAVLQSALRKEVQAGSIDVNIMTKLDKTARNSNGDEIQDGSDAVTALRGYAKSDLVNSTVVLSAGMNPRLFAYMEKLDAFDTDESGEFRKKIAIKVSDYRSALIQGKMLAKRGLWVSEYRIESGLNCGGHAFATDGFLIGTILEEFKNKRSELQSELFEIYKTALEAKGRAVRTQPEFLVTMQGGIGTYEENKLLSQYYEVNSAGWGTPFLLVPEATTVDEPTLKSLALAQVKDVKLSHNSPLGIRFHYLKGTTAEQEKLQRILDGKPGSPCTEKYLVSNTEFGEEPVCTASRSYQKKKLAALENENLEPEDYKLQKQRVLDKECLCVGLSNAAVLKHDLEPFKNRMAANVCPGPNIAYFSKIVSLKTMVDHIYGRANIIQGVRPHMFLKELSLYVDYWKELVEDRKKHLDKRHQRYVEKFRNNLCDGITYYRGLSDRLQEEFSDMTSTMNNKLDEFEAVLNQWLDIKPAQ
ncbi:MAG: hypothetical protein ABJG41_20280 [Cyclobacteriaceae bacterium]